MKRQVLLMDKPLPLKTAKADRWLIEWVFFVFLLFCLPVAAHPTVQPCDLSAYLWDPAHKGLNIRQGPGLNYPVLKRLPPVGKEWVAITLNIHGNTGLWVRVSQDWAMHVSGNKTLFKGIGWVYAPLLGTSARGENKLYRSPFLKAPRVTTLPSFQGVTLLGCRGSWAKVQYQQYMGWLSPHNQCPNPLTTCP